MVFLWIEAEQYQCNVTSIDQNFVVEAQNDMMLLKYFIMQMNNLLNSQKFFLIFVFFLMLPWNYTKLTVILNLNELWNGLPRTMLTSIFILRKKTIAVTQWGLQRFFFEMKLASVFQVSPSTSTTTTEKTQNKSTYTTRKHGNINKSSAQLSESNTLQKKSATSRGRHYTKPIQSTTSINNDAITEETDVISQQPTSRISRTYPKSRRTATSN